VPSVNEHVLATKGAGIAAVSVDVGEDVNTGNGVNVGGQVAVTVAVTVGVGVDVAVATAVDVIVGVSVEASTTSVGNWVPLSRIGASRAAEESERVQAVSANSRTMEITNSFVFMMLSPNVT